MHMTSLSKNPAAWLLLSALVLTGCAATSSPQPLPRRETPLPPPATTQIDLKRSDDWRQRVQDYFRRLENFSVSEKTN